MNLFSKYDNNKRALIFGITGQDGALLAKSLLGKGYTVAGTTRDFFIANKSNLENLKIINKLQLYSASLTDFRSIWNIVKTFNPTEIYNLTGQSSVGLSFEQPIETFESIALSTYNTLELLRLLDNHVRFYNACSSECFGNSPEPADENTPFRPRSPYAVAKAASFWAVANYREAYGLFACSGILTNHESPYRSHRFVTRKIVNTAVRIAAGSRERLCLGNMSVIRDWGWAEEYVEAMWRMLQLESAEDFVIATGKSYSLHDFTARVFNELGLQHTDHVDSNTSMFRPTEIQTCHANPSKAERLLGWKACMSMPKVVKALVVAEMERLSSKEYI